MPSTTPVILIALIQAWVTKPRLILLSLVMLAQIVSYAEVTARGLVC